MKLHYHTTITIEAPGAVSWFITEGSEFMNKGSAQTLEQARLDSDDYIRRTARLAEECGHGPIKSTESVINDIDGRFVSVGGA